MVRDFVGEAAYSLPYEYHVFIFFFAVNAAITSNSFACSNEISFVI